MRQITRREGLVLDDRMVIRTRLSDMDHNCEQPLSGQLIAISEKFKVGKKAVFLHGNADPDALGSAYAIYRCFPEVTVVAVGA